MIQSLSKWFLIFLLSIFVLFFVQQQVVAQTGVKVFTTAKNTNQRLSFEGSYQFQKYEQLTEWETSVFVDTTKKFQEFMGVGAAFTDAAAETFYKLPVNTQQQLLRAYFDKDSGINYSIIRTNMNSCDFSSESYTYVSDNDVQLKSFSIDVDKRYKIPFIKEALLKSQNPIKVFVSPWSPPAWMKDNNNMLQGGKLLPQYYNSWANYFVKFIKSYEAVGIPIWGLTIQNEPMAKQRWESCIYTAHEETDFLKNFLGPQLVKQGLRNKKIIVWEHNRDLIYQRAQTYLSDKKASQYIWGIGFHWYEDWSGGTPMYENVKRVKEAFPEKNLFFTEGCAEGFDSTKYELWALGEKYARNMINDFNNGMVGFTDWNILLDEKGGPNHVQNYCFAPIHGDTRTGKLIYTNAYYYIGHFSKFIPLHAKRIAATSNKSQLLVTAFKKGNQSVAVVMNQSDAQIQYNFFVADKASKLTIPGNAIQTIIF